MFERDAVADKVRGKKLVLVVDGKATLITSDDGDSTTVQELPELTSTHEETDR